MSSLDGIHRCKNSGDGRPTQANEASGSEEGSSPIEHTNKHSPSRSSCTTLASRFHLVQRGILCRVLGGMEYSDYVWIGGLCHLLSHFLYAGI